MNKRKLHSLEIPCKEKHIWFFQLSTQNQVFKNRSLSGRRGMWTWHLSAGYVLCQWIQRLIVHLFWKLLVSFKMIQLAFTACSPRTTALSIRTLNSPHSGVSSRPQGHSCRSMLDSVWRRAGISHVWVIGKDQRWRERGPAFQKLLRRPRKWSHLSHNHHNCSLTTVVSHWTDISSWAQCTHRQEVMLTHPTKVSVVLRQVNNYKWRQLGTTKSFERSWGGGGGTSGDSNTHAMQNSLDHMWPMHRCVTQLWGKWDLRASGCTFSPWVKE